MKKKRAILIVSCLIVFITGILTTIIIFNNLEKKIYTTKYIDEMPEEMLAIMIQNTDGTYLTLSSNSFNQSGYRLNKTKSYCVNGGKLEYEVSTQKIKVQTSGDDKCYIYLDMYTKTFADKIVEDNGGYTSVHAKTLTKDGISEAAPKYKYTEELLDNISNKVAYVYGSNLYWVFGTGYTVDSETGIYSLTGKRVCNVMQGECAFLSAGYYFFEYGYATESEALNATDSILCKLTSIDTSTGTYNYDATYDRYYIDTPYTEQISASESKVLNGSDVSSSDIYYLQTSYTFDSGSGKFIVKPTIQATTSTLTALADSGMYFFIDSSSNSSVSTFKKSKLYKLTSKPKKSGSNIVANVAELTAIPTLEESSSGLFTACSNIQNYRDNTCADDGYTYFFRGRVNNNWVSFAGAYWRIVRINQDGTVKLIYAGTNAPTESTQYNGTALSLSETAYSTAENALYDAPSSALQSTMSFYLGRCYNYSEYLSDQLFAVPRIGTSVDATEKLGEGYSKSSVTYGDKYNATRYYGNGKLSYSIGLLTITEAQMAGLNTTENSNRKNNYANYLYNGAGTWLMPYENDDTVALHAVDKDGIVQYQDTGFNNIIYSSKFPARSVINLNSNVLYTGSGTYNDPYVITGLS